MTSDESKEINEMRKKNLKAREENMIEINFKDSTLFFELRKDFRIFNHWTGVCCSVEHHSPTSHTAFKLPCNASEAHWPHC